MNTDASPAPVEPPAPPRPPQENVWLNLACNAVLPGVVLTQLSKETRLGPAWGLVVALSIPLAYGTYDLVKRRTWNVFAIIGLVGTLITGGLGLLKLDNFWFAVKAAALPMLIGLAIPMTLRTRQPLVKALLYNEQVLDTHRIGAVLAARGNLPGFEALLRWASWVLAATFFVSGILNYFLARWIVTGCSWFFRADRTDRTPPLDRVADRHHPDDGGDDVRPLPSVERAGRSHRPEERRPLPRSTSEEVTDRRVPSPRRARVRTRQRGQPCEDRSNGTRSVSAVRTADA